MREKKLVGEFSPPIFLCHDNLKMWIKALCIKAVSFSDAGNTLRTVSSVWRKNLWQEIVLGLRALGQVFASNSHLADFHCCSVRAFTYFLLWKQMSDWIFCLSVSLGRSSSVVQVIFYIGNPRKDFQEVFVFHKVVRMLGTSSQEIGTNY